MAIPKAGAVLRYMLRAGTDISGLTLTRFYALHVAVLPIVMVFFLAVHFLMVRRLGISKPM
jgi:quinol-cytochrome oxidoreductase complex cytochrome b subunit